MFVAAIWYQIGGVDTPSRQSRSGRHALRETTHKYTRPLVLGIAVPFLIACTAFSPRVRSGETPAPVAQKQDLPRVDRVQLFGDLSILAHDSMEGRRTGTVGNERARRFLIAAFEDRGFSPVEGERTQEFPLEITGRGARVTGASVLGMVEGREFSDRYLVISAHYDHLGGRGREIYNGADDNASGTAALLAVGKFFEENRPRHSLLLVAFDAEEVGLLGARAFISDPPVPLDAILLNVNLDMVSRSESAELYAAGTYHYPSLAPFVGEVAARTEISLLLGHDSPDVPTGDDWTSASDHGPFHEAGIPFIYFGVEDHPGYHRPSDTFENVTFEFYLNAVETIVDFIEVADREGETIN